MRVRSDHQACDVMMDEGGRMDEGEWVPIHSFIRRSSFNHHASIYSFFYSFTHSFSQSINQSQSSINHSFIHSLSERGKYRDVTQVAAAARCGHPAPGGMRAAMECARCRGLAEAPSSAARPGSPVPRGARHPAESARRTPSRHRMHRGTAMRHRLDHRWRLWLVWFGLRLEQKRNAALPPKQRGGRRPQTAGYMFLRKK